MSSYIVVYPGEDLNFPWDWTDALSGGADIATSAWQVTPNTPTIDQESNDTKSTSCNVSGFTAGEIYQLTNTITTTGGTTEQKSVTLRCENK